MRIFQLKLANGETQTKTLYTKGTFESWLRNQGRHVELDNGLSYLKSKIVEHKEITQPESPNRDRGWRFLSSAL
jgi:hypothetical protein